VRYNECNGVIAFIARNWLEVLQSVGIIVGLFTTGYTLRKETQARRVGNLFTVTKHHREIWSFMIEKPELARVLNPHVDLTRQPITDSERLFVRFLILHLATSFEAQKREMYLTMEGLKKDVQNFFGLPIPRAIWEEAREYQQRDFMAFVDKLRGVAHPERKGCRIP